MPLTPSDKPDHDLPELGNLAFGHSRGDYRVPRDDAYEDAAERLRNAVIAHDPLAGGISSYWPTFENPTFATRPYWWGDETAPEASLPNLIVKEGPHAGYALSFYKYPLRDSYANKDLSGEEFTEMVAYLIRSLNQS